MLAEAKAYNPDADVAGAADGEGKKKKKKVCVGVWGCVFLGGAGGG